MLFVKDFKIALNHGDESKWEARAWNTHSQFMVDSESPHYALQQAIQGCLEYHVARYFEAAYIVRVGTNEIVYKNLACLEFEKQMEGDCLGSILGDSSFALVTYQGGRAQLDIESEYCHGFRIVRVVAVRFLSTVPQGSLESRMESQ